MLVDEDHQQAEWDVPRPVATCRHLLAAARLHDIDAAVCLGDTGLTVADIDDNATEVQAGQELRILRNILARVDDSHDFARDVGLQYNFANMGILGYALLASPTIGDAINAACRYAALSSTFLRLTRHDNDEGAVIEFDNSHVPTDVREFMLERDMYAITNLAPLLVGQMKSDVMLTVEVPGFELPLDRLEFPRLTIEIDTTSQRSAIVIPVEVLQLGMPAADAATAQACVQQCEDLLQARRQRRGTAALVRARLIRDPGRLPSMAEIAREFSITERTMHRRLAAEHTSYRALVDEVRVTLASALLESGLTVEETARQLGYSETAAFTRAFIRTQGEPPSKRRRR
ncbi:AraC family transcriptional regulator ligand-binding domain-containing protein [Candidatus Mycobacterium wuenschmannii]|uniref:AraC family transcriptional regulator ligand-binding domain-containing protein n=1 Tax=Candidatus Mycobacterium wuenschmannii TaxID=3027808 RepID=A0ABY8VXP1_9MYCO|nr:AraC family transcriptional regulator [Candidatus Mycobacterium wuenschmannii]WIM88348.1 AraC family transcriptional regulator ligand-binding domain-containing protein [Candidatus Mycobacterium wuenschmannii]